MNVVFALVLAVWVVGYTGSSELSLFVIQTSEENWVSQIVCCLVKPLLFLSIRFVHLLYRHPIRAKGELFFSAPRILMFWSLFFFFMILSTTKFDIVNNNDQSDTQWLKICCMEDVVLYCERCNYKGLPLEEGRVILSELLLILTCLSKMERKYCQHILMRD